MTFDSDQVRVLGTLIEKEITTPESYPLSLNALMAGCNQKSSRYPILELDEDQVRQALHRLEAEGFVTVSRDSRVPKYEHRVRTILNLRRDEAAVLCLLLLRGPQTPGELRSRADRMYAFDGIAAVESTLQRLIAEAASDAPQPITVRPLVAPLPRQAGSREVRYTHLLSGSPALEEDSSGSPRGVPPTVPDPEARTLLAQRVKELESKMEVLRGRMDRMEQRLDPSVDQTTDKR